MRKLKLAIFLPVLQCVLEGILWYWGRHAQPSVPVYEGILASSATLISFGLNAPAELLALLVYSLMGSLWNVARQQQTAGRPGFEFVFLLCVFGCWYLIGRWLDRRASGEDQDSHGRFTITGLVLQVPLLGAGIFFLLLSFHWLISSLSEIIAKALLETWAAFLIGLPGLAIAGRVRNLAHGKDSIEKGQHGPRPRSNFHLLIIVVAVFAALLIYGFLTHPNAKGF